MYVRVFRLDLDHTCIVISTYSLVILITVLLIVNCFMFMVTLVCRYRHELPTDLKRQEKES
jgi:hypothetical protein